MPSPHVSVLDGPVADAIEIDADEEPLDGEDVLAVLMRAPRSQHTRGRRVLEVNQVWGDLLVDTRQFAADGRDVTIGASLGYRWRLLGVDMGRLSPALGRVLPYLAPLWSDVGRALESDFYVPAAILPGAVDHPLFRRDEGGSYVANVEENWDGFVNLEDRRVRFDELVAEGRATRTDRGYAVPMTEEVRLTVDVGGQVFFAQLAGADPRLVARPTDDADYPLVGMLSFGVFLFAVLGASLYFDPALPSTTTRPVDERVVELLLQRPEDVRKTTPEASPDAGEGARSKKDAGKIGKKEARLEKTKGSKVDVAKQEKDRDIAEDAGLLGALQDDALDRVLGASGLPADLRGGIGGLIGALGTPRGSGGLGDRRGGLGGGGTVEGIGGLGTKGPGPGSQGYGKEGGDLGRKGEGGIGSGGGDPIILGSLDRSLVDAVIKRHMAQIRYCYQRELARNPSLGGKIAVKFVIARDGTVSSAATKTSTLNDPAVDQCIVGHFMTMQFPEPRGGGVVIVSYPFLFAPG